MGIFFYLSHRIDKDNARSRSAIDSLFNKKERLFFNDSVTSAITKKITDSLQADFALRDEHIKRMEREIKLTRRQYEELRKLYNSIGVGMPDY